MESKYRKVDQKMFDAVKLLLENGATQQECADYLKLSTATVKNIKSSETLQEYRNRVAAHSLAKKQRQQAAKAKEEKPEPETMEEPVEKMVVEHRQNVTVQTTYYVSQKLDKIVELLTVLNGKIGFIVDELAGVPHKKEETDNG